MENVFKDELLKDEKILWQGMPNPEILFSSVDFFLIPFSLIWEGFAVIWVTAVFRLGFFSISPFKTPLIFFALFGILFVITGLYFIFGRFIFKKWKKRNTYYAVTNKRIIIITKVFIKRVHAEFIEKIPSVNYSQGKKGCGSVRFGNANFTARMNPYNSPNNQGLNFPYIYYGAAAPAFYDIDEPKKIYELVNRIRKG
jgi:hypothetical protein